MTLMRRAILRGSVRATIGGRGSGGRCRSWAATSRTITLVVAAAAGVVALARLRALRYLPRLWPSPVLSLPAMVSALCAIGTAAASALNGFGCVSMPHTRLVGVLLLEPTPPAIMAKLKEDMDRAIGALEEKRWLLADAASQQHHHQPSPNLVGDMEDNVWEMNSLSLLPLEARTAAGCAHGLLGVAFSIVLIARVLFAVSSLLSGPADCHRRGGDSSSPSVAIRAPSFGMGCYLLACVTVVKMNLPAEYRRWFSAAVGGPNFGSIDDRDNARLMNTIFLPSVCVSAITLASLFGIQRNNSPRYRIECFRLSGSSTLSLHFLA